MSDIGDNEGSSLDEDDLTEDAAMAEAEAREHSAWLRFDDPRTAEPSDFTRFEERERPKADRLVTLSEEQKERVRQAADKALTVTANTYIKVSDKIGDSLIDFIYGEGDHESWSTIDPNNEMTFDVFGWLTERATQPCEIVTARLEGEEAPSPERIKAAVDAYREARGATDQETIAQVYEQRGWHLDIITEETGKSGQPLPDREPATVSREADQLAAAKAGELSAETASDAETRQGPRVRAASAPAEGPAEAREGSPRQAAATERSRPWAEDGREAARNPRRYAASDPNRPKHTPGPAAKAAGETRSQKRGRLA